MTRPTHPDEAKHCNGRALDGTGGIGPLRATIDYAAGFLDPDLRKILVAQWWDRQLHGRIAEDARAGHALLADDMRGLAPGLLAPRYYRLDRAQLATLRKRGTHRFLEHLIARRTIRVFAPHVVTAIRLATRYLAGPDGIRTLAEHAADLDDLASAHGELYEAALLGDFVTARSYVERVGDAAEWHRLMRILAGQRIVWGAADVHRVAARGSAAARYYVPWFLRAFIQTYTAAEYMAVVHTMASTIVRIFGAADKSLAGNPSATKVHVRGQKGPILTAASAAAAPIEPMLDADARQAVLDTREPIRAYARDQIARIEAKRAEPGRSDQETRHQEINAGLSEIAALFVTAYRFAEDEARMRAVIADPAQAEDFWDVGPRPYPAVLNNTHLIRARHLVAAYRPAILVDFGHATYDPVNIRLAEKSELDAQAFLLRVGGSNAGLASLLDRKIAGILDLSHACRSNWH